MDVIIAYRPALNRFSVAAVVQTTIEAARHVALDACPDTTWICIARNFADYATAVRVIEEGNGDGVLRCHETISHLK